MLNIQQDLARSQLMSHQKHARKLNIIRLVIEAEVDRQRQIELEEVPEILRLRKENAALKDALSELGALNAAINAE